MSYSFHGWWSVVDWIAVPLSCRREITRRRRGITFISTSETRNQPQDKTHLGASSFFVCSLQSAVCLSYSRFMYAKNNLSSVECASMAFILDDVIFLFCFFSFLASGDAPPGVSPFLFSVRTHDVCTSPIQLLL